MTDNHLDQICDSIQPDEFFLFFPLFEHFGIPQGLIFQRIAHFDAFGFRCRKCGISEAGWFIFPMIYLPERKQTLNVPAQ